MNGETEGGKDEKEKKDKEQGEKRSKERNAKFFVYVLNYPTYVETKSIFGNVV